MSKKRILVIVACLLILAGALGYGWWRYQEGQWTESASSAPNFTFVHPAQMVVTQGSDEEKQKGEPFIRITEGTLPDPLLISIRQESGLRIVTSLAHQDLIPLLLGNAEKALPERFTGYEKESEQEFEHDGKKAAEIIFTYQGPSDQHIKQRFLIIAYDGNTALYLAAQSKEADFDELNNKYFNRILASLSFE